MVADLGQHPGRKPPQAAALHGRIGIAFQQVDRAVAGEGQIAHVAELVGGVVEPIDRQEVLVGQDRPYPSAPLDRKQPAVARRSDRGGRRADRGQQLWRRAAG
jgi:hypothetical protein